MADINVKINLITKQAEVQIDKLNVKLQQTDRQVQNFGKRSKRSVDTLSRSFRNASIAFGSFGILLRAGAVGGGLFALSQGIRKVVNDFADFETALVGVGKTTNLAGRELAEFGKEIQELSFDIPVSTNELLRLSQVAAQLGVKGSRNLQKFAEVGARLAVSTDLAGEDAVTSLARILGVTGGAIEDVDKLGSALVALGNTFKAQESEILTAAGRVARATARFNLAADQTLAIGAALKEAGVEAESGGSAVGKIFGEIAESINDGGVQLETFTEIIGLTGDELEKTLATDSAKIFKLFISGLNSAKLSTTEFDKVLRNLELTDKRVISTLGALVKINDRVQTSFETSSDGVRDNTALYEESDRQFNTVRSSLEKLNNAFTAIFTNLGGQQAGALKTIIDALATLAKETASAVDPTKKLQKEISELQAQEFESKIRLDELNKSLKTQQDELAALGRTSNEYNRRIATTSTLIKQETDENDKIVASLKRLEEQRLKIIEARRKEREVSKAEKEDAGGDGTQDARVQKEREVNNILDLLRQSRLDRETELEEEEASLQVATQDKQFDIFVQGLGRQEAARTAARARELIADGKFDQAKKLLAKKRRQAEENAAKAQLVLDKQVGQQRIGIASNLGALINAAAGKETKAGFILQQGAAAAQVIVQSQIAQAKALAALPLTGGEPLGSLIRVNTGIQLATIAAQTVAGFQDGGVVGGASNTGDKVLARVNSGEMILNRSQQTELFELANGRKEQQESQAEQVINTTVELDGDAVARAVSRRVADGTVLGEFE